MTYDIQGRRANRFKPYRSHFPRYKKSLGQNFLINSKIISRFVKAASLSSTDTVIEIGPGRGSVTRQLAAKCQHVIAIEKDDGWSKTIQNLNLPNVTLLNQDFLDLTPEEIADISGTISNLKVISSLPYNISKKILYSLLYKHPWFSFGVFIIQKEVAEDYCSQPPNAAFLSRVMSLTAECQSLFNIEPSAFVPRPRVDSTVIQINRLPQPILKITEQQIRFLSDLKKIYQFKRKTFKNALEKSHLADDINLSSVISEFELDDKRAEQVDLAELVAIWKSINNRARISNNS